MFNDFEQKHNWNSLHFQISLSRVIAKPIDLKLLGTAVDFNFVFFIYWGIQGNDPRYKSTRGLVELAKCTFFVTSNGKWRTLMHGNMPERTMFWTGLGEEIVYDHYLENGNKKKLNVVDYFPSKWMVKDVYDWAAAFGRIKALRNINNQNHIH